MMPVLKAWEETFKMQMKRSQADGVASPVAVRNMQQMVIIDTDVPHITLYSRLLIPSHAPPLEQYKAKASSLYSLYRCHPLKTLLLPWTQIPLWITVSLSLRSMAAFPAPFLETPVAAVEGFATGGTSWFVDLAAQDPTMIFPLSIGFMHLCNIELNRSMVRATGRKDNLLLTSFFRALSILIIPVATQVPMALNLYWATSAAFSLTQNLGFWWTSPPPSSRKAIHEKKPDLAAEGVTR
ncbi:Cytochrome c oxidase assembly protein cox18, mitochondrial [Thoreauomyces humboldtii]|nr:Cytochrome c oxidase assembly protein cox18, mitochondrial [Thoreauomyces humboldtii]